MKREPEKNVFCQATSCRHFNTDKRVSQHCLLISIPYDPNFEASPMRIGKNGECANYNTLGDKQC